MNGRSSPSQPHAETAAFWQARFSDLVRWVVAPVLLCFSGFFTMDFVLSGIYTWPRSSRIFALSLTLCVLAYEFVYKDERSLQTTPTARDRFRAVVYSCLLPYAAGGLALLILARVAR